ncbi:hypothetical protein [Pseudomonas sp. 31 R 17]|jgi:hypothetical protein|nr:hypothetical protein [Pseudomonas sp. 24 E 13]CRM18196.1 hypothetical protein [Pseudomonas sp. 31 R 17]CRM21777.1 hypothetical protein [Pseudomonas sp. 44 R 15]CRM55168.1 hypothetical protein [Pseudomonas sp. 28 E 9]CRN02760.1 hypothetical protein [Pseudomonas sp. 34 E 7]
MSAALRCVILAVALVVLLLAWWGWQQGGLALMQLGMAIC